MRRISKLFRIVALATILSLLVVAIPATPALAYDYDIDLDPDTGEILQEYVPAIIGIDPLPATIEQNTYDDEGNLTGTETILNPCIVQDEAERSAAQEIINDATTEVLTLADEREE